MRHFVWALRSKPECRADTTHCSIYATRCTTTHPHARTPTQRPPTPHHARSRAHPGANHHHHQSCQNCGHHPPPPSISSQHRLEPLLEELHGRHRYRGGRREEDDARAGAAPEAAEALGRVDLAQAVEHAAVVSRRRRLGRRAALQLVAQLRQVHGAREEAGEAAGGARAAEALDESDVASGRAAAGARERGVLKLLVEEEVERRERAVGEQRRAVALVDPPQALRVRDGAQRVEAVVIGRDAAGEARLAGVLARGLHLQPLLDHVHRHEDEAAYRLGRHARSKVHAGAGVAAFGQGYGKA
mmetsp:Transcript_21337/g.65057  ORF Transcript_21337/g.65057 Transcript_21337/m.65057 type:complete len:301 (+) Transcript_21337:858-1760(+)